MSSPTKKIHTKWNEAQRTVLNALHTQFDLDAASLTNIFNAVFKEDLEGSGISDGLTHGQLESQWRNRAHKGREHLWAGALRQPRTDAEQEARAELIDRIHDAAATLGISTEGEGRLVLAEDEDEFEEEAQEEVEVNEEQNGDASEEMDEADEQDDEIQTSPSGTDLSSEAAEDDLLDMLHTKDINWVAVIPAIKIIADARIDRSSPVYQHGGEVHRVAVISEKTEADFMTCNIRICSRCFKSADPAISFPTDGLPFIHSSDTTRKDKRTIFAPTANARVRGRNIRTFLRFVSYKGMDGVVECWTKVCGNVGCEGCVSNRLDAEA